MVNQINFSRQHMQKLIIYLILSALTVCFNVALAQQLQTINPTGGVETDYSDGMALFLGDRSDIQMFANNVGHLYSSTARPPNMGSNTISLRLQAGAASARIYSRNNGNLTAISQSTVTGSGTAPDPWQVVTTFRPTPAADSGIRITLTDRYISPSFRFTRRIDVTGIAPADTAKLYWYFDSMVGGNDSGNGFATPNTLVGTRHPTTLERLEFQYNNTVGLPWDRFFTGRYSTPASLISSGVGDLNNFTDTTNVDAGMALQWNVPLGNTSFTAGSDLVYVPAGIFARETFTPETISVNSTSRMKISLTHVDTTDSLANFTYTLPLGSIAVAAIPNVTNTCAPAGGTIAAIGNTITVTNLPIQAMPANGPAYSCDIEVDVRGTSAGLFQPQFTSGDQSVGHSATRYGQLEVLPVVFLEAQFNPNLIIAGGSSLLTINVTNLALTPQTGQDFIFNTYDSNLLPVSPTAITSTCSNTPTMTIAGSQMTFSQLNLTAASSASTPSQCTITLAMTSSIPNRYYAAYFDGSTTGVGYIGNTAMLRVEAAIQASARFVPPIVNQNTPSILTITLVNASPLPATNGHFVYDLSSNIPFAPSNNLTTTCPGSPVITTVGTRLEVTNLSLAGNASQPTVCTISITVDTPDIGSHYASFYSPDSSVASDPPHTALQVMDSVNPVNAFIAEVQVTNPTVSTNQQATVTITLTPDTVIALTDIDFTYNFDSAVQIMGAISQTSGCENMSINPSTDQILFTGLTLQPSTVCQITFNLASPTAGFYNMRLNPMRGAWWNIINGDNNLMVMAGFARAASDSIPTLSIGGLFTLTASLLWLSNRRRRVFKK